MAEVKSFRDELIEKVFLKMIIRITNVASNVIKFYPDGRSGKCITLIVLFDGSLDPNEWKVIEVPDKTEIDSSADHIDLKIYNALDYFEWNWIKDESELLLSHPELTSAGRYSFADIDDSNCSRYQLVYKFEMDVSKLSSTLVSDKLNSDEIRKEVRDLIQSHIDRIMGDNKNDEV